MAVNKKTFDKTYWDDQINSGKDFRKKYAREGEWDTWRAYYRGHWQDNILPVNLFFSLIRTVVPRVYFRNPGISITPGMPGPLVAAFAQVLERTSNKLVTMMKLKKQIKKVVQDSFMFGTGALKLGFGAQYTPTPQPGERVEAPLTGRGRQIEFHSLVNPNMPWLLRVHPGNFIVPEGTEDIEDARWVANEIHRALHDVKADPRFKNTADLKPTRTRDLTKSKSKTKQPLEQIVLYEIKDREYRRVIVMAEGTQKELFMEPDELQQDGNVNYYPLVFNQDDEVFWGVPESAILEPQQLEINEVNTKMMQHWRLSIVKVLAAIGAIDKDEAEKMVSPEVAPIVWVNAERVADAIVSMTATGVPPELLAIKAMLRDDVREQQGMSRNQAGQYADKAITTATEASIVDAAASLRVDERRDMVSDMLVEAFRGVHSVIFNHWTKEEVIDIAGPGGIPLWVRFRGSMLKEGAYVVQVDPDTMVPQTRDVRMQKAAYVYNTLKQNPLIDPIKLTRYLLREFHGVEYDDLMRGMPKGAGGPQNPLSMAQFAGLQSNAGRLGLPSPRQGGV
jgi:hypothetical protein